MNSKKVIKKIVLFCFFSVIFPFNLFTTTVFDQANAFFSSFIWTINSNTESNSELPASSFPGGTETFPIISSSILGKVGLIYPEIKGVGSLDYSSIPTTLIITIESIIEQLKKKNIKQDSVTNPYIAIVTSFRLNKLPEFSTFWFSRPIAISDNTYTVIIKAIVGNDSLLMNASFIYQEENWLLDELYFDGRAYATLARQN